MTTFKTTLKLIFKNYGIIITVILFSLMMSFLQSEKTSKSFIAIKTTNETEKIKGLKNYLNDFYNIIQVNDYDYDLNTGKITSYIEINDDLTNPKVHEIIPSGLLTKRIDQYIHADNINDFTILNKRIPIQILEVKDEKMITYFSFLGFILYTIGGTIVSKILFELFKTHIINKTNVSGKGVFFYIYEILSAILLFVVLISLFFVAYSKISYNSNIETLVYPFFATIAIILIAITISAIAMILTNKEDITSVIGAGYGTIVSILNSKLFPEDKIPDFLQKLNFITPHHYYMKGFVENQTQNLFILYLFVAVFIILTALVIKTKSKSILLFNKAH